MGANRSTQAWWLTPAVSKSISGSGTPTISASCPWVFCTEWHSPTIGVLRPPAHTAQHSIAIGLV